MFELFTFYENNDLDINNWAGVYHEFTGKRQTAEGKSENGIP